MNSIPRAILATVVVAMFLAGMMIVPSYASINYNSSHQKPNTGNYVKPGYPNNRSNTQHNIVVPEKAQRCPNGYLAPDNDISKCPPLI